LIIFYELNLWFHKNLNFIFPKIKKVSKWLNLFMPLLYTNP